MKKKSGLLIIILLLAIGFAAVSTSLVINGTSFFGTNSDNFDVIFTKAVLDGVDVSGNVISQDGKSIIYTTNELKKVDETSVLDFEVTNNSTQYDAKVSIECVANGEKNNYYEIIPEFVDVIHAKEIVTGKITIKLKNNTTEEIEETFKCSIEASAQEKTDIVEIPTYRLTGILVDSENNPVKNANIAVYSETPTYAITDEFGKFQVYGLELGAHELYYVKNKTIAEMESMTKNEVKEFSESSAVFSTNALTPITASNGYSITNSMLIKEDTLKWKYTDLDDSKTITVGDVYSYKNESFNIISQTKDTVTMLAKYNLGTNYRQSTAQNGVKFSDSYNWLNTPGPKEIDIFTYSTNPKVYINEYVTYLNNEFETTTISGNLMTLAELSSFGCIYPSNYKFTMTSSARTCKNTPYALWLINGQNWWLRSADSDTKYSVWTFDYLGELWRDYYNYSNYSIRPTITISKETLEK